MSRDHRSSLLDDYDAPEDAAAAGPWPGKTARTDQLAKATGAALPGSFAEGAARAYGETVSDVRVHTDDRAGAAANRLGAEAFTHGSDVYFAPGKYQPESEHGKFVMMHELAHVVQSRGAEPQAQAKLEVGSSDDAAEVEADV